MTLRVEVKNLDEVKRILAELGPRAKAVLPEAVEEGAKVLQAKMITMAPGPGIGIDLQGTTAFVGPLKEKFYYAFFETGTSRHLVEPSRRQALKWGDTFAARAYPSGIAPEPFMRPAIDEGADEIGQRIGEILIAAVE